MVVDEVDSLIAVEHLHTEGDTILQIVLVLELGLER